MQWQKDNYIITDEQDKIDMVAVIKLLQEQTYWANNIPALLLEKAIKNSLCFSILQNGHQIGFARFSTDYAIHGYLDDVVIDKKQRGKGLGKWLMSCIFEHPVVSSLYKIMLATEDAHGLYRQYGFKDIDNPEMYMARYNHEAFKNGPTG